MRGSSAAEYSAKKRTRYFCGGTILIRMSPMTKLTLTLTLIDPQDDEKNIMVQIEVGLMKKSECK